MPRVNRSNDTDNPGRIRDRRGAGKEIVATARKLLTIIYGTLGNRWTFENFANFKPQQGPAPAGQHS